ncbi:Protein broad-minded [Geodia barretti]|uniref:Protein broad-minded n=2 Tax=Geodia barretti TaxID=519541 RepID=A0AA35RKA9_GEOBA|nr:Protein broad-minded [Geodia barretti]
MTCRITMSHAETRATTSMEAGEAASRELKFAVREVVGAAMGHLGTQRQRSCEEVLTQLPLLDNSFYCYELVRQLQSLISSHLSPMVTRRVGGARLERENFHYTAAVITEDILESNQYKQICQSFTSALKETVQELLDDSTHQLLSPAPHSSLSQTTQYFSLDSSLNSDLSQMLGQTALWSTDQLVAIAADLAPSLPTQVRIEAMHHLLQFPIGDLVAMDTWSQLKPVLSGTLMDSDPRLAGMSLTLHCHLLSSHSPTSSLEALLSLSHNLSAFFLGKEGVAVTMAMGIDPADDRSLTVIQRMNLLNRFQRDVVSYWIRFGHRTVEDIVRATFDLLSLGNDTLGQLRPIHYLSLLDPTAQWARDWTHGEFSRSVVVEVMRERPGLLEDAVRCLMSSRLRGDKQNHLKPSTGYYNEGSLHYLHFSHSLSLFGQVVRWKNGRKLFPITLDIGKCEHTLPTAVEYHDFLENPNRFVSGLLHTDFFSEWKKDKRVSACFLSVINWWL